jgi:hypothetical protein
MNFDKRIRFVRVNSYWPNEQHTWLHAFEDNNDWQNISYILEQLYAQMMGWA